MLKGLLFLVILNSIDCSRFFLAKTKNDGQYLVKVGKEGKGGGDGAIEGDEADEVSGEYEEDGADGNGGHKCEDETWGEKTKEQIPEEANTINDKDDNITIYGNDYVYNLYEETIDDILYDSPTLWMVEFYRHWCGDCMRAMPHWKALAENVKDWSPIVKIAVINCEDQAVSGRYRIVWVPTIKIFYPHSKLEFEGFEVPYEADEEYFVDLLLYSLTYLEEKTGDTAVSLKALRKVPRPNSVRTLFDGKSAKKIGLIFERDVWNSVGRKVVMDLSKKRRQLPVYRIDINAKGVKGWGVKLSHPTLLIVSREGKVIQRVAGTGEPEDRVKFRNVLRCHLGWVNTRLPELPANSSTQTPVNRPDIIHQSDIENAIQRSIKNELATQDLDEEKLEAINLYLTAIIKFFPHLKKEIKSFLIALRKWSVKQKDSKERHMIPNNVTMDKVEELLEKYKPFEKTPAAWQEAGCMGSEPRFRGYPCSLWTTFHTLLASAAEKDSAWKPGAKSTVAVAIVKYMSNFFSCGGCRKNFLKEVAKVGDLPTSPDASLLWLWKVHNLANHKQHTKGSKTEDPQIPKVQWPNPKNCPSCRKNGKKLPHTHEAFNEKEVLKYIKKIYNKDNIVQYDD